MTFAARLPQLLKFAEQPTRTDRAMPSLLPNARSLVRRTPTVGDHLQQLETGRRVGASPGCEPPAAPEAPMEPRPRLASRVCPNLALEWLKTEAAAQRTG